MNKQNPLGMNEGARRMIFAGVPVSILAVIVLIDSHEHIISEKFWPYIFFGIMLIVTVLGMITYNITPKRLTLPLGSIGWAISFLILFCSVK
jgi:hypothetical protein